MMNTAKQSLWLAAALCWAMLGDYGWMPPIDAFPRARAAAERALELDPTNLVIISNASGIISSLGRLDEAHERPVELA